AAPARLRRAAAARAGDRRARARGVVRAAPAQQAALAALRVRRRGAARLEAPGPAVAALARRLDVPPTGGVGAHVVGAERAHLAPAAPPARPLRPPHGAAQHPPLAARGPPGDPLPLAADRSPGGRRR